VRVQDLKRKRSDSQTHQGKILSKRLNNSIKKMQIFLHKNKKQMNSIPSSKLQLSTTSRILKKSVTLRL